MIPALIVTLAFEAASPVAARAAEPGPEAVPPGVVVEAVQRGFAAERAGVRKGDVVVSWSQRDGAGNERRGEIPSPLLLADLEYGHLPRGPVTLEGFRGEAPLRIEIAADAVGLGVTLRPRFPPALLGPYSRGRELVRLPAASSRAPRSGGRRPARAGAIEGATLAGCWLLAQTGTALAVAKQADAAREAYDEAVSCAEDGDTRAVATILEWQADQEYELGQPEVTAAALETAFGLRDTHPESSTLSGTECLFNLTATQRALGRTREAREY